jgi:hypothetical protein
MVYVMRMICQGPRPRARASASEQQQTYLDSPSPKIGAETVMQRVRIEKPRPRRERWWSEVLPLDPRDPDVRRARGLISNAHPHERGPMTA